MADNFENLGFQVEVEGANDAISRLDKIIERLDKLNERQEKQHKQSKKPLTALSDYITKIQNVYRIALKFGDFLKNIVDESSKYVENLNLFAVSFGETYQETLDWALNLADAYGLANNEIIKFAGTFRELSASLGIVGDTADSVTEVVTNLGYDLSALFNTTVESAMQKLQSGIFTGNVRPLRSFGIDISQGQIEALFQTNEELAKLGINATNLSQSDKVLARLLVTLQSTTDSFGTMAREINNLQSQLRILQGSWANFQLAVGDLISGPFREALVWINAFLIGITDVIRAFVPLQKEDKTPVSKISDDAEDASEAIDNLNGKLATFDKFNALGGQSSGNSSISATEILNKLLEEQASLYNEELAKAMEETTNEAVELAKSIRDFFIEIEGYDEAGNAIYKLTTQFKVLLEIVGALGIIKILGSGGEGGLFGNLTTAILECATSTKGLTTQTTLLGKAFTFIQTHPIVAAIAAAIAVLAYFYTTNEDVRNSINMLIDSFVPLLDLCFDLINQILEPFIPLITTLVNLLVPLVNLIVKIANFIVPIVSIIIAAVLSPLELVAKVLESIITMLGALFSFNFAGLGEKLGNIWQKWSIADTTIESADDLKNLFSGYENGGYTNANLIMTHENGKREWVGKAAGSSAIVNDTQMSDIMEGAVAKGVYRALDANAQSGANAGRTNNIYKFNVNGRELFSVVEDEARRQGKAFKRG